MQGASVRADGDGEDGDDDVSLAEEQRLLDSVLDALDSDDSDDSDDLVADALLDRAMHDAADDDDDDNDDDDDEQACVEAVLSRAETMTASRCNNGNGNSNGNGKNASSSSLMRVHAHTTMRSALAHAQRAGVGHATCIALVPQRTARTHHDRSSGGGDDSANETSSDDNNNNDDDYAQATRDAHDGSVDDVVDVPHVAIGTSGGFVLLLDRHGVVVCVCGAHDVSATATRGAVHCLAVHVVSTTTAQDSNNNNNDDDDVVVVVVAGHATGACVWWSSALPTPLHVCTGAFAAPLLRLRATRACAHAPHDGGRPHDNNKQQQQQKHSSNYTTRLPAVLALDQHGNVKALTCLVHTQQQQQRQVDGDATTTTTRRCVVCATRLPAATADTTTTTASSSPSSAPWCDVDVVSCPRTLYAALTTTTHDENDHHSNKSSSSRAASVATATTTTTTTTMPPRHVAASRTLLTSCYHGGTHTAHVVPHLHFVAAASRTSLCVYALHERAIVSSSSSHSSSLPTASTFRLVAQYTTCGTSADSDNGGGSGGGDAPTPLVAFVLAATHDTQHSGDNNSKNSHDDSCVVRVNVCVVWPSYVVLYALHVERGNKGATTAMAAATLQRIATIALRDGAAATATNSMCVRAACVIGYSHLLTLETTTTTTTTHAQRGDDGNADDGNADAVACLSCDAVRVIDTAAAVTAERRVLSTTSTACGATATTAAAAHDVSTTQLVARNTLASDAAVALLVQGGSNNDCARRGGAAPWCCRVALRSWRARLDALLRRGRYAHAMAWAHDVYADIALAVDGDVATRRRTLAQRYDARIACGYVRSFAAAVASPPTQQQRPHDARSSRDRTALFDAVMTVLQWYSRVDAPPRVFFVDVVAVLRDAHAEAVAYDVVEAALLHRVVTAQPPLPFLRDLVDYLVHTHNDDDDAQTRVARALLHADGDGDVLLRVAEQCGAVQLRVLLLALRAQHYADALQLALEHDEQQQQQAAEQAAAHDDTNAAAATTTTTTRSLVADLLSCILHNDDDDDYSRGGAATAAATHRRCGVVTASSLLSPLACVRARRVVWAQLLLLPPPQTTTTTTTSSSHDKRTALPPLLQRVLRLRQARVVHILLQSLCDDDDNSSSTAQHDNGGVTSSRRVRGLWRGAAQARALCAVSLLACIAEHATTTTTTTTTSASLPSLLLLLQQPHAQPAATTSGNDDDDDVAAVARAFVPLQLAQRAWPPYALVHDVVVALAHMLSRRVRTTTTTTIATTRFDTDDDESDDDEATMTATTAACELAAQLRLAGVTEVVVRDAVHVHTHARSAHTRRRVLRHLTRYLVAICDMRARARALLATTVTTTTSATTGQPRRDDGDGDTAAVDDDVARAVAASLLSRYEHTLRAHAMLRTLAALYCRAGRYLDAIDCCCGSVAATGDGDGNGDVTNDIDDDDALRSIDAGVPRYIFALLSNEARRLRHAQRDDDNNNNSNRAAMRAAVLRRIGVLVRADAVACARFMHAHLPAQHDDVPHLLRGAADAPRLLLRYLDELFAKAHATHNNDNNDNDNNEAAARSLAGDQRLQDVYIDLLCAHAPSRVYAYVRAHERHITYDVQRALRAVRQHGVDDAAVYMLGRTHAYGEATRVLCAALRARLLRLREAVCACAAAQDDDNDNDDDDDALTPSPAWTSAAEAVQHMLDVGLDFLSAAHAQRHDDSTTMHNNDKSSSHDAHKDDDGSDDARWFRVLDVVSEPRRRLCERLRRDASQPQSQREQDDDDDMTYNELLHEATTTTETGDGDATGDDNDDAATPRLRLSTRARRVARAMVRLYGDYATQLLRRGLLPHRVDATRLVRHMLRAHAHDTLASCRALLLEVLRTLRRDGDVYAQGVRCARHDVVTLGAALFRARNDGIALRARACALCRAPLRALPSSHFLQRCRRAGDDDADDSDGDDDGGGVTASSLVCAFACGHACHEACRRRVAFAHMPSSSSTSLAATASSACPRCARLVDRSDDSDDDDDDALLFALDAASPSPLRRTPQRARDTTTTAAAAAARRAARATAAARRRLRQARARVDAMTGYYGVLKGLIDTPVDDAARASDSATTAAAAMLERRLAAKTHLPRTAAAATTTADNADADGDDDALAAAAAVVAMLDLTQGDAANNKLSDDDDAIVESLTDSDLLELFGDA